MPSSWLLTMLCPKLDVEPFPTLSGVRQVISCLFFTHPKTALFRGAGMGKLYSLYDCMIPTASGPRSPSLSDALSYAHGSGPGGLETGLFSTGAHDGAAGSPAPGSEPKQAGEGRKSCPLSRALAASSQGTGEQDMLQAGFLWWSGNQL